MNVELWAEIRRLRLVEKLSQRTIAERLHCSRRTVAKALALEQPPLRTSRAGRRSILDPYKPKIAALLEKYPDLSAVRILEEIRKGPDGFRGQLSLLRRHVRRMRPNRKRVYQEVFYEPGQAMQVDWGCCGRMRIGETTRHVSVFVAVLCYSRLCYLEFCLSQRKAEFYRALAHAIEFFQGAPRQIIFDNLKAAVINGSGRQACLHPEFLALCGHFCLQPIACERRDPESKGIVEGSVRYIKRNALAGRSEELATWEDYLRFAASWRDEVANVRLHATTRERPRDRFEKERGLLRALPGIRFDADEVVSAAVSSHARVRFDGNRYSTPPELAGKTVLVRADGGEVRVLFQGEEFARHERCYGRGQLICLPTHQLAALQLRRRQRARDVEESFDALGAEAQRFHLELLRRPVKTAVHLRRLLQLVRLYGRQDVLTAIAQAHHYQTFDAAYVESLLLQERRRRELPSPTEVRPKRAELLEETDLEEPNPADYDRLCEDQDPPEPPANR